MRINIIPPSELTDQHLVAEYCEILMLCGALQKTLNSKKGFQEEKVPDNYVLGEGHAYFFFNKGLYLKKRFELLKRKMNERNIKTNKTFPTHLWSKELYNDWLPDEGRDFKIIRERIAKRIEAKPGWYKKDKLLIDTIKL